MVKTSANSCCKFISSAKAGTAIACSLFDISGWYMGGGWGCPHEIDDLCSKVNNIPCDPGMKGCVLYGRFVFYNDDKNERQRQKKTFSDSMEKTQDRRGD